jgi:hypothetical protein
VRDARARVRAMSGSAAPAADASSSPRLPPFFPRAPAACAAVSEPLFACLTTQGEYVAGGDPGVGRAALAGPCAPLLPPYAACVAAALTARQKELARAPQAYLSQLAPRA